MITKNEDYIIKERILSNDRMAFKKFYNENYKSFFLVCLRYAKSKDEAQDFLQDGFINIFKDLYQFDPTRAKLKTWAKKVIINCCPQKLRKKSILDKIVYDFSDLLNIRNNRLEAIENLSIQELVSEIRKLPRGYQTVFNLHVIDGYNHKEIGKKLGISPNTSKTQLMKAKNMLRHNISAQTNLLANGYV